MQVSVGPLPSSSALAWIGYAREVITGPADQALEPDLLVAFEHYLGEWQAAADHDACFVWTADVPSELVEYQMHAFYRIVSRLSAEAERRGTALLPPDGELFYLSLVEAVIDALTLEGTAAAEFADQLRNFWPGLWGGASV